MADKAILGIAAVALVGAGVFVLLKGKKEETKEQETDFRNLQGELEGPYLRYPGEKIVVNMTWGYIGPGGVFDAGVGVSPAASALGTGTVTNWYQNRVTLPEAKNWTEVKSRVEVTVSKEPGKRDILKFIQVGGGDRDPKGEGFLVANWDRNVFEVGSSKVEIRNMQAGYQKV